MFKHPDSTPPHAAFLDIKPWGNNLGVRIPAAVARAAKLRANQRVMLSVEEGRVVITPQAEKSPTLLDRLALFDPVMHGGELMETVAVGAEKW
ncbi:MAG: AbrB/MazE/SpoVT family DNA-binding domain-containing protein [Burkholderiaceae bacterium]